MKLIPVGNSGANAIVDDDDYNRLSGYRWSLSVGGYPIRQKTVMYKNHVNYMHRDIMGNPDGVVDHINRNKLDNRRSNLRVVGKSENALNNGPQKNNTSGHRGVDFDKRRGKWCSRIKVNKKVYNLGRFDTKEGAVEARKAFVAARQIIAE